MQGLEADKIESEVRLKAQSSENVKSEKVVRGEKGQRLIGMTC